MLKFNRQSKTLNNIKTLYRNFINTAYDNGILTDEAINSYHIFRGACVVALDILSRKERKILYQHIARAERIYHELCEEYNIWENEI